MAEPTNRAVVAELRRMTALFQLRAIAAVMGVPAPVSLPPAQPKGAPDGRAS